MDTGFLFKTLLGFLGLYLLIVISAYVFQRHLLYHPGRLTGGPAVWGAPEMHVVKLQTADNLSLNAWYRSAQNKALPTIIYFHGNAGHLGGRVSSIHPYLDAGFGVLLVGYRGYDGNAGQPTEQGLYRDGRAAIQFIRAQGVDDKRIVLIGESLGSGVAVQMGIEFPIAALVLKGAFTSVADVAEVQYPFLPILTSLIQDRFDNLLKISRVDAPVLSLHGGSDKIVPTRIGRHLYNMAREPKQWRLYPNTGHNDLMDKTFPAVDRFLRTQGIIKQ